MIGFAHADIYPDLSGSAPRTMHSISAITLQLRIAVQLPVRNIQQLSLLTREQPGSCGNHSCLLDLSWAGPSGCFRC